MKKKVSLNQFSSKTLGDNIQKIKGGIQKTEFGTATDWDRNRILGGTVTWVFAEDGWARIVVY
jgi:hypothetical protein